MAVFIVLWPYLLTTKLKSVIRHNLGHSIKGVCLRFLPLVSQPISKINSLDLKKDRELVLKAILSQKIWNAEIIPLVFSRQREKVQKCYTKRKYKAIPLMYAAKLQYLFVLCDLRKFQKRNDVLIPTKCPKIGSVLNFVLLAGLCGLPKKNLNAN